SRWWAEAAGCASWIGRIRRTGAADQWARRSSTTVPTDGGSELQDYPRALARGARQLHGPCAKWRRTLRGAEHPPVHTAPPGPADPAADGPPGDRDGSRDSPGARRRRPSAFP